MHNLSDLLKIALHKEIIAQLPKEQWHNYIAIANNQTLTDPLHIPVEKGVYL